MRSRIDKRNYNRLKTHTFKIEYKLEGTDEIYEGEVINISAGGICFLRTAILEKGDIIIVKFPFKSKKIILKGTVIRIDGREVGIKFLNTDNQIEKYVEIFNEEYPKFKKKTMKIGEKLYSNKDITYNYNDEEYNDEKNIDDIFDIDNE